MSRRKIKAGTTSVSVKIFVQDSSSTTGAGLSGVTNASSGLVAEYRKNGASSWTPISVVGGKTLGTWTSGGWIADGSLGGAYEFDIPDAAFTSATSVAIRVYGVTNMLPVLLEFELDAIDYQDATAFGISRLDAAVSSRSTYAGGDTSGTTTLLSRIVGTLAAGTHNAQSGDAYGRLGAPTGASIAADIQTRLATAGYTSPPSAATISSQVAADLASAHGSGSWSTIDAATIRSSIGLATANLDTQLSAINAKTANLPSDPADASDIAASFATVNSSINVVAGYIDTEVSTIIAQLSNVIKSGESRTISRAGQTDITFTETRA